MAGRALRLVDVPVALGLLIAGHLAMMNAFSGTMRGDSLAVRVPALATMGGLGAAILAFLISRYRDALPWGGAIRRTAAGFVIGAASAAAWALAAG